VNRTTSIASSREGYRDERAERLRRRYRACFGGAEVPVPVESIAEDLLGLIVEERELGVSGALLPAERQVYLNAGEPPTRRRFTLAHELGHWVCQCLEGASAPVYCRHQDVGAAADRALEREANIFAAERVMPEAELRAAFAGNVDVAHLAARFGVSPLAMQWRLYSFGLAESPAA